MACCTPQDGSEHMKREPRFLNKLEEEIHDVECKSAYYMDNLTEDELNEKIRQLLLKYPNQKARGWDNLR